MAGDEWAYEGNALCSKSGGGGGGEQEEEEDHIAVS